MKARKRVLNPRPLSLARGLRSPAEKEALIQEFRCQRSQGRELDEIAADLGVSASTIYRWEREKNHENAVYFDVGEHIANLCRPEPTSVKSIRESLFNICAFIRWPNDRVAQEIAIAVYISTYLRGRYGDVGHTYLPNDERAILDKYLTVGRIAEYFGGDGRRYPDFTEYKELTQGYADSHLLKDIVAYLINASGKVECRRSLTQAYNRMDEGLLGVRIYTNKGSFDRLWKDGAAASPFHYVDQEESHLQWFLDPADPDFAAYVEEACDDHAGRASYFAMCLWIIETLRRELPERTMASIRFPSFPTELSPVPPTQMQLCVNRTR